MEYYKELFFTKRKHSYDLYEINFHADQVENIIRYNNTPSKGFKLVGKDLLDPVTGYIFHPENSYSFKDKMIRDNVLINGVCTKPIIFEYVKDGTFIAHLYEDVQDELIEVSVQDKVSLSESKPGTILRNIEDESYYIYMGMVGQFYVTERGKGSVKKKHLVLKTDYVDQKDDDTILIVYHLSYIDYKKDKDKSYFQVNDISPEKLKVKYYSYGHEIIPIGDYIKDDKFQVYDFQREYPSLLLSGTVRIIFAKDDISMTRNKVNLDYEYLGETGLDLICQLKYGSFDMKAKTFFNIDIDMNIESTDGLLLDFYKYNYAVEIDGEKYLVSPRRLLEINTYTSDVRANINLFQGFRFNTDVEFYRMSDISIVNHKSYHTHKRMIKNHSMVDWSKKVKIYKVEYVLNDKYRYNIFEKPFTALKNSDSISVLDKDIFDFLKNNNGVAINIFGDG
jgi:hypothetical protein